jgi:hypothetical protein
VSGGFEIRTEWLPVADPETENGVTSAAIELTACGKTLTRIEDDWSRSVHSQVRVSAYPLALWFAASWWRLRWEPGPASARPGPGWRMAHEMAAAGHGFVWPPISFQSDAETIEVRMKPSEMADIEPIRYLSDFAGFVDAGKFENEVAAFIELVKERLDTFGLKQSGLHQLWSDVCRERLDPAEAIARRIEAQLGMDPGEAPAELIDRIAGLRDRAGLDTLFEIAIACSGSEPARALDEIVGMADSEAPRGRFDDELGAIEIGAACPPGEQGWMLARSVRQKLGLGDEPVGDSRLAALLGIEESLLSEPRPQAVARPVGLAIRDGDGSGIGFHFRKRNHLGLRFEAARFIADNLIGAQSAPWLLTSDTKTARQKLQRAFAAEFLCPVDGLKSLLRNDFSPSAVEEASMHFGVSEWAVESHLANHKLIPREDVRAA